jgi:phage terminase small subunit
MSRTRQQAAATRRRREANEALPDAPQSLSPEALTFWREAVESVPAGHFRRPDFALLAVWSEAHVHLGAASKRLAKDAGDAAALNAYVKLAAAVTSMSSKLRLCPSARNPRKDVPVGDACERDSSGERLPAGYFGGG